MAEDIKERTFKFASRIIHLCDALHEQGGTSRTLSYQLIKSGTSIGANAEEAHAGQSKADFIAKLQISLKEARETHYWLRLLVKNNKLPPERLNPITQEANELVAILTTILKNAKN